MTQTYRKLAINVYYEVDTADSRPVKDIEDSMEELIFDALDLFNPERKAVVIVHEVVSHASS